MHDLRHDARQDVVHRVDERTIGTLLSRVVDDAKRLVRAEITVQVATAKFKANEAKLSAALLGGALLLAISAVTVLVAALGALIALLLGADGAGAWSGGLAAGAVIALVIAGALAYVAIGHFSRTPEKVVAEAKK